MFRTHIFVQSLEWLLLCIRVLQLWLQACRYRRSKSGQRSTSCRFAIKLALGRGSGWNVPVICPSEFRQGRDRGFVVRVVRARLGGRVSSSRSVRRRISAAFSRDPGPMRGQRTRMLRPILLPSPSRNVRRGLWLGLRLFRSRCRLGSFVFVSWVTGVGLSTLRLHSSSGGA